MADGQRLRFSRLLDAVGHSGTPWALGGVAASSGVAALALSTLPGGWYSPQYWFTGLFAFSITWFVLVVLARTVRWSRAFAFPPDLVTRPRGGDAASIEVRPTVDMECYGRGWLIGSDTGLQRSFDVAWEDTADTCKAIRGGDVASLTLAYVSTRDRSSPHLCLAGNGGAVQRFDLTDAINRDGRLHEPTPWMSLRIELRSKQHTPLWTRDYRVRLSQDWRFEIQDVTR